MGKSTVLQESLGEEETNLEVLDQSLSRNEAVRADITETKARIESDYLHLAELLTEARDHSYFSEWGYRTFPQYCDEELGIQARKVQYMISIFEAVRDLGLSDRRDTIERIGWTKMRMLVHPMRRASENGNTDAIDALLTQAEVSTAKELQEYVRAEVPARNDGKVSISFRADQNTASIILDAIDTAKAELEVDAIDLALEHICYDYVQRSGGDVSRLDLSEALEWVNKTFGTEFEIPDTDPTDIIDAMEE